MTRGRVAENCSGDSGATHVVTLGVGKVSAFEERGLRCRRRPGFTLGTPLEFHVAEGKNTLGHL